MKRGTSISDYLRPLEEKSHQVYLTNELQVADVLEWILSQVGRSEVWQTSFSISEEFLRRLYFITRGDKVANKREESQTGLSSSEREQTRTQAKASAIHLVLDFKATNKTLHLWRFIDQVISSTHLADNHSKVLLVRSASGVKVSIITSQNLTRGNRNEAYIITTEAAVFDKFLCEVEHLIKWHSVPLSEILSQKISEQ
jgi:hypothetical protein